MNNILGTSKETKETKRKLKVDNKGEVDTSHVIILFIVAILVQVVVFIFNCCTEEVNAAEISSTDRYKEVTWESSSIKYDIDSDNYNSNIYNICRNEFDTLSMIKVTVLDVDKDGKDEYVANAFGGKDSENFIYIINEDDGKYNVEAVVHGNVKSDISALGKAYEENKDGTKTTYSFYEIDADGNKVNSTTLESNGKKYKKDGLKVTNKEFNNAYSMLMTEHKELSVSNWQQIY